MKTILLLTSVALLVLTRASNAQIIYPTNNDFTSPSLAPGTFVVAPTDAAWSFSPPALYGDPGTTSPNGSGIAANGGQNLAGAPSGQAAFLQDISSVSQSITLSSDANVSVTFDWEGRTPQPYTNSLGQPVITGQDAITVTLGGIVLLNPATPTNTTSFESITTAAAEFSAGTYNLTFSGVTSGATTFVDDMTFIDDIQVNTEAVPEPSTSALTALGGVILFVFLRRLKSSQG